MFSNYLSSIEGIEIYPIFSLLVFFIFFVVLAYKVVRADKVYLQRMENLPLDTESLNSINEFEINRRV